MCLNMNRSYVLMLLMVVRFASLTQSTPINTPYPRLENGNKLWMDDVVAGLVGMISGTNTTSSRSDRIASPEVKPALEHSENMTTFDTSSPDGTSSLTMNSTPVPTRKSAANTTIVTPDGKGREVAATSATTTTSPLGNVNLNLILKNIFGKLGDQQTSLTPIVTTTERTRIPAQDASIDWREKTLDMLNTLALGNLPDQSNQSSSQRLPPNPNSAEPLVDGSSSVNAGVSRIVTQDNNDLIPTNNAKDLPAYNTGVLATPNEGATVLNHEEVFTLSTTVASDASVRLKQSTETIGTSTSKASLSPFLLDFIAKGLLKNSATPSQQTTVPSLSVKKSDRNEAIDAFSQTSHPEITTESATDVIYRTTTLELTTSHPISGVNHDVLISPTTTRIPPTTSLFTAPASTTRKTSSVTSPFITTARTAKASLRTSTQTRTIPTTTKGSRTGLSSTTMTSLQTRKTRPTKASTAKAFRATSPTTVKVSSTTTASLKSRKAAIFSTTMTSPKTRKTTPAKTTRTTTVALPTTATARIKLATTSVVNSDMRTTKKQTVKPFDVRDKEIKPSRVTPPAALTTTPERTTAGEEVKFTRPTFLTPARLPKLRRPVPDNHFNRFHQKVLRTEATSQKMPVTQSSISSGALSHACYWTNRAYLIAVMSAILVTVLHT